MKGRTNTFFTSDWHIGHANVLEFDKRPFRDLEHMHEVLVNNYNSTVKPGDICYFLGDMGLCKSDLLASVIAQLKAGIKVLILGNHDKGATAMKSMGFDVVLNSGSLVIGNQLVTMSHCPLRGVYRETVEGMRGSKPGEQWHGETRHGFFSIPEFGGFHLHGHTHKGPEEREVGHQYDVGVKANNYRPISISQIESWIGRTLKGAKE